MVPKVANRGEHLATQITSSVDGPRLVRCHVFGPDGSLLPIYSQNLLLSRDSATFTLPSALNDPIGNYIIRATDVVSGATVETTIVLK